MIPDLITLVDQSGQKIGSMDKLKAHQAGCLHLAFSIFIFNDQHELLLQRRAQSKYHSGGLWSNTCCGHPRPDETVTKAATRRLQEEMGFSSQLTKRFNFVYKEHVNNQLIEHEYDYVLTGTYNHSPVVNPNEVCEWLYADFTTIQCELAQSPERYSSWFKLCYEKAFTHHKNT